MTFLHDPDADDAPPGFVRVRRTPRRGRAVLAWLALSLALALACAAFLGTGLAQLGWPVIHIDLNGNDLLDGVTASGLDETARDLLGTGALLAALLLLVLLPALLLLALVIGLGLPLLAVALALGLVLAIVASPLWLVGLAVWALARRGPAARPGHAGRMAA